MMLVTPDRHTRIRSRADIQASLDAGNFFVGSIGRDTTGHKGIREFSPNGESSRTVGRRFNSLNTVCVETLKVRGIPEELMIRCSPERKFPVSDSLRSGIVKIFLEPKRATVIPKGFLEEILQKTTLFVKTRGHATFKEIAEHLKVADQGNVYKKVSTYLIKHTKNSKHGLHYLGKNKGYGYLISERTYLSLGRPMGGEVNSDRNICA
jgi:hypothetical protein